MMYHKILHSTHSISSYSINSHSNHRYCALEPNQVEQGSDSHSHRDSHSEVHSSQPHKHSRIDTYSDKSYDYTLGSSRSQTCTSYIACSAGYSRKRQARADRILPDALRADIWDSK